MAYELIWEPQGVVIRFFDVAVWEDLVNYKQELFSDPRSKSLRYQIFDARDLTDVKVNGRDAIKGAQMDRVLGKANTYPCRVAAVSDEEHIQLLAGFYGMALDVPGWQFATFVDMDLARNWIGSSK